MDRGCIVHQPRALRRSSARGANTSDCRVFCRLRSCLHEVSRSHPDGKAMLAWRYVIFPLPCVDSLFVSLPVPSFLHFWFVSSLVSSVCLYPVAPFLCVLTMIITLALFLIRMPDFSGAVIVCSVFLDMLYFVCGCFLLVGFAYRIVCCSVCHVSVPCNNKSMLAKTSSVSHSHTTTRPQHVNKVALNRRHNAKKQKR